MLWIGGPPGSGKTTIAKRIARRHGLRWYGADAHTWEHRDRALRDGNPAAHRWEAMTPDERRSKATPDEMFAMSLHIERGPMIVDDLRRLPTSPLIVAEGTPISPAVVTSGVAERTRAVWLVPTPEFQRAEARNPLYSLVGAAIEREVDRHDAPVLTVDGSRGVDEMVAAVEKLFAEALSEGPYAETSPERRDLLRYANVAVVSQCLAYLTRPWSTGDPESLVRAFVCECDDPECQAVVERSIASASAEPVFAPGHG